MCVYFRPGRRHASVEHSGLSRLGLNQWCGVVAACHAGASLSYTRVLYLGSGYLESGARNCLVGFVCCTFLQGGFQNVFVEIFFVGFFNFSIDVAFGRVCHWAHISRLVCCRTIPMPDPSVVHVASWIMLSSHRHPQGTWLASHNQRDLEESNTTPARGN